MSTSDTSLAVSIGGMNMKNPVMTASGTFGFGEEYCDFLSLNHLGGFVVKGTTILPRQGNPYPRMVETPSGMLNAVGLQNGGVQHFIDHIYPHIKDSGASLVVNVSGSTIDDYCKVCELLLPCEGVEAVEINISCPNVKQGGMAFGTTCNGAAAVTSSVRKVWPRTMIVKLSPNVSDITEIARAVEAEGADSVSLINTLLGMSVDVKRRRAHLSTITGGLSGPAVRPVALRMVWQTAKAVSIPVIGLGGITDTDSALQFIMAGATAIQVGTANFVDPSVTMKIVDGIQEYCSANGISDIAEIRGII